MSGPSATRLVTLKLQRIYPTAIIPRRWSPESVGWDLHAYIVTEGGRSNKILIPPNATRNIPTGLNIEPPAGHFLMVCSRSGVGKDSILVANAPGIIDPDYRGEIKVLLYNGSYQNHWVEHEQRIAQLVSLPVVNMTINVVEKLTTTLRGDKGFGSTGS